MTFVPIQCDNCGAKYKLPESFSGSQAKCQKCGSVIDVAGQRAANAAPAAPAAAKPAAARPAAARPAVARPAAAKPAAERPARASKGRAAKDDDGDKPARGGRRGRGGDEAKKSNSMPLILGGVGLIAVVVVVVLMMNNKGDDTTGDGNSASNTAQADKPADKPVEKPAEKPADKPAEKPAEATADKTDDKPAEKPAEATADKPAEKPADKPTETGNAAEASTPPEDADPSQPKQPWQKLRNPPQTMDEVTDPKTYPEVQWPASIDEATKTKIRGLLDDVAGGGVAGIRAKPQLTERELRYAAMFGIVEKLRTLNYRDNYESGTAFELNKVLEDITAGLNARFAPVEATENIHPAKAEWNTRTVNGWLGLLAKYPDEETFQKERAERVKKQAEENK